MKKSISVPIPQITSIEQADAHQRKHGFKPLILSRERTAEQQAEIESGKHAPKGKLRANAPVEKTLPEKEMTTMLERRKALGEIKDFKFQAVALLWGGSMRYKADFAVRENDDSITLIEVKGYMIRDRDIVRFKGCRNEWQWAFAFEFHQREKGGKWSQLL